MRKNKYKMLKKIIDKYNNENGISLTELVVSVAVFSIVVTMASGIFINSLKAQKTIIAKQNVADNLRYTADFIFKELRMPQVDTTDATLTFKTNGGVQLIKNNSPSSSLAFINSNGKNISYSLLGGKVVRNDLSGTDGDQPISSDEITVTDLKFILNNWDLTKGSGTAPLITVIITAKAANGVGGETKFQTSVSPRIY